MGIRDDRRREVRNECVETTFCGSTAYNPHDEGCCPLLGQHFNSNTNECESCPAVGSVSASFNPSTQQCCPADRPNYIRDDRRREVRNECVKTTFCGSTAYNPRDEGCCPLLGQHFNFNTNECESCPADPPANGASINPVTQQCSPADTPFYFFSTSACEPQIICGPADFNHREGRCCPIGDPFNFETEECESTGN